MEATLQLAIDAVLVVALVGVGVGWFRSGNAGLRRAYAASVVLLLFALAAALSAVIVPAGNVAVVTAFGQVQTETLPPGLHFRVPFVNAIHLIQTRVQPHNFQAIDAATQENLTVKVTGTMNYHVDGAFAAELYQAVGDDFASKVIDPAFSDYIKQIIPSFSASSEAENFILDKREDIRSLTKTQLGANLARYHIVVDDIYIVDIAYPAEYDAAITAKQVAQQQVQTENQVLAQKQIQAQQAVAVAKGQADAQVTLAQGQAKANDLIKASLTPEVIQYTAINKLNPNVTTILLPVGSNFLLPSSLFEPQKPQ
jgi:regulator of protease activity HflC (stomatin/prohibitin superfamily)